MRGRLREICRGVNVDLGTAAVLRDQWRREASALQDVLSPTGLKSTTVPPRPLILGTNQAVGDAVVMTAAIYSLHKAYPGKYITAVDSQWPDVFEHNPDVKLLEDVKMMPGVDRLNMHYPAIHDCNVRGIHFMDGWCEHLGASLGIRVPLLTNRPHLYFDTPDPVPNVHDGGYWLVCSGGKNDFTNKLWGQHNYQEVIDLLKDKIKFIQVGATPEEHPPLRGVLNAVGGTTLRDLFEWTRRASGILCGVSLLMHIAAALEKPAVVIAGGREPVQWNAYPLQHYVHTVGILPCRSVQGQKGVACWRSRVVSLGDNNELDKNTCEYPVVVNPAPPGYGVLPKCMTLIHPRMVADLVATVGVHYPSMG